MAYNNHLKLDPNGNYGMYLRKSRADQEAEAHGAGETLKRHYNDLMKLAKKMGIHINEKYIYKEVVSGETIAARPEVQRMLADVTSGILKGMFVVEIERFARGDTSDQGTVAKAFKLNNTLIITPTKIYEPDNESDEEYFEFGLFMSRREYKTINRRIQNGRVTSAMEGRYIGSVAPYGYEKIKIKNDKGYSLKIKVDQADVVRSIFTWYVTGILQDDGTYQRLGASRIADKLNDMGIKPSVNDKWTKSSIITMLHNPIYSGKIRWGYKKEIKSILENKLKKHRTRSKNYILSDGLHEAIINENLFNAAQNISVERSNPPVPGSDVLKNPFTGIVYCGKCGRLMTRLAKTSKTPYDAIKCMNKECDNISSPLYVVEDVIIESLKSWVHQFKMSWEQSKLNNPYNDAIELKTNLINQAKNELLKLNGQRDRLYNLLEQEVYSVEIFMQRNSKLSKDIEELEASIANSEYELEVIQAQASYNDVFIPRTEYLLDNYFDLDTAAARNTSLKEIVERIEYVKNEPNKRGNLENKGFRIELFPRIIRF